MADSQQYHHMYVHERMARNLGVGNIGEAFFRHWFQENIRNPDLVLLQIGYNPDDIVVGEEKVKLLKSLKRSPDYCVFRAKDVGTNRERPLMGISVNLHTKGYTMWEARSATGCHKCSRNAQELCYDRKISNVWFNKYNIDNDYKGFRELFNTDVILVTPTIQWADSVKKRIEDQNLADALLEFIRRGNPQSSDSVSKAVDIVLREQRRSKQRPLRKYGLRWLLYSDVLTGKVPHSVTGGNVQYGRPREVVCINMEDTRDESQLIQYLNNFKA